MADPAWLAPTSLEEALSLRAEHGDELTVLAGGTFLGVLVNQGLIEPSTLLSLHRVEGLSQVVAGRDLEVGAMVRHRAVERSAPVRRGWPALADAFGLVASPRIRHQATVGGVVADADYASDPPAMLAALRARAVVRSVRGEREVPIEELITGYYETSLEPDELVVSVRVPEPGGPAVYRKFRSRSHEDRPCVAVAAACGEAGLRVVVGAVAGHLQWFPEVCDLASGPVPSAEEAEAIAAGYADRIEPIADVRGSSAYRTRVIAVEVRRALEALARQGAER